MSTPEKKKILVLGAGGFIGRRIVSLLAASNWARPLAASRHIAGADLGSGVDRVPLDATRESELQRVLEGASGVVSCIAGEARDIMASGTALFTAAARLSEPPRIVYLSSMAAYGLASGQVDEAAPLRGDLGDYGAAKAAIDQLGARYSHVVRLRPGIVYGPGSPWWSDRIARLLVTRRLGDLGPAGAGRCNLVHVDDVAQATLRALTLPLAGGEAFNLGSALPPTWNEYFAAYAHALGALPLRQIGGARMAAELYLAGPLLKIIETVSPRLLAPYPAIRPWLTTLCRHDLRIEVAKAQEQLAMQWTPLQQGLASTATWFLQGGRA